MAQRLAEVTPLPDLLLVSPAIRTRQTADSVMRHLALERIALLLEESLYLAEPDALLSALARAPDAARHVLLVGHNPGLSELARRLAPNVAPPNLPTGGWLTISFIANRWNDLAEAPLQNAHFDYPARLD